jgi:hypothetical protein
MSDHASTPIPDEPDQPLPPDAEPTAEQAPIQASGSTAEPTADQPVPPAANMPPPTPPSTAPLQPAPPWRPGRGRLMRRGPLLPLATGLIGLMLGIVIGAAGLGLIVVVARHVHQGPAFRGDNRARHFQDNRQLPRPGQFGRPLRPGGVPTPTPS